MNTATAKRLILLPLLLAALASCGQVAITGRRQLNLVDSAEMNQMSATAYGDFLKENKLSGDAAKAKLVKDVGVKIKVAVEAYFASKDMSAQLDGYDWQFNLVDSKEVNAWCMPGGRVVVYTGILPIAKTETGLAVVMGHEIAHAIANHGNERMSQGMLVELGTSAIEEAMAQQPQATKDLLLSAVGLGAKVGVLLPYSRLHESEADRLGLIFMAMAGYDPREAAAFWQRMAELKKGAGGPEFLSTHPADETRVANLKRLAAEEAMKHYKPPGK